MKRKRTEFIFQQLIKVQWSRRMPIVQQGAVVRLVGYSRPVPPSWPRLCQPKLCSGLDLKLLSRENDQSSNVNNSLTTGLCHALYDGSDPAPLNYRVKVSSVGQQNKLSKRQRSHCCIFLAFSIPFDGLNRTLQCVYFYILLHSVHSINFKRRD